MNENRESAQTPILLATCELFPRPWKDRVGCGQAQREFLVPTVSLPWSANQNGRLSLFVVGALP